jgi:hypothetical protein
MSSAVVTVNEALKALAPDLSTGFPRSPRFVLGGFVLAGRMLDKCRAVLAGTNGEFHYNCPLDKMLLEFSGLNADAFKAFVATGANDEAVGAWIKEHTSVKNREDVVAWNNKMRDTNLSDLPISLQLYMEDYVPQFVPAGKIVYRFFDIYDYEEGRL